MDSVCTPHGSRKPAIRVLALVEAETVNGPVKNLLSFYHSCQEMERPSGVQLSLAVFERLRGQSLPPARGSNEFLEAASKAGIRSIVFRKVLLSILA